MKKRYLLDDGTGKDITAELEDGVLNVKMTFFVDKDLTIEEVCENIGWKVVEEQTFEKPKLVTLERNDNV